MLQLAMKAHEQDITLNKMVERILNEVILAHQKTVTDLV
jgi:predicted HicB family RNase H-like nuclease